MELRKMTKLDLDRKRGMFFNIGLAISLALVLTAFEWKSAESPLVVFEDQNEEFEILMEVPLTQIPPPPPPVQQPVIQEVSNEEIIEEVDDIIIDQEFTEELILEDISFDEPIAEKAEEYIDFAEHMPIPLMGIKEYYRFISKNMKYPNQARRMGIEGKVFVQFIVSKEGEVTHVKTMKGIGGGCDEEAERVISLSPKWKPGKQGARSVNVRMVLPVYFNLQ
ncbi:energy transducer TonB [Reichenbachiella sp. MALMAid0571]|uniref:energy transducer TonB n=1 Tax=Reichenbachiella sp. MALMAid0571 TaxID=3143939 RepID=UPI0032DF5025